MSDVKDIKELPLPPEDPIEDGIVVPAGAVDKQDAHGMSTHDFI